jgi:hypothetical protein
MQIEKVIELCNSYFKRNAPALQEMTSVCAVRFEFRHMRVRPVNRTE